jgi:hypothetical protein
MGFFSKKEKEEGLIESYGVIYKGGHPHYPKEKNGEIEFKVFEDRFEFHSTMGTKNWFNGITIPITKISDLQIVQRQIGSFEGLLGGLNSRQLNQANNIHISYESELGEKILIRLEMLSGVTVMGQAKKCLEFEDRLRVYHIREKFVAESTKASENKNDIDIPSQIEKLAALLDKGIISQQEFDLKKTDLLSKM